jgi:hypothetical protein
MDTIHAAEPGLGGYPLQDRQLCHVEVFGETNRQQVMKINDLSNFLTHLKTFHNLVMTLTTLSGELLVTLMTLGEDILMTLTTLMKVL